LNPHAHNVLNVLGKENRACLVPEIKIKIPNADLIRLPGVPVLLVTIFLITLSFNFFYVAFPLQAATKLQWSVKHTGAFFSVMSVCMVVTQAVILPRMSQICGDKILVCTGAVLLGFGFLALAPVSNWMPFVSALLIALGNGLMWPPVVALLSKTSSQHQGAIQGLAGSVTAAASIIGLFFGAITYPFLGGWIFVLSAGFIFAIVFLSMGFSRKEGETKLDSEKPGHRTDLP
jgi:MFS family permease